MFLSASNKKPQLRLSSTARGFITLQSAGSEEGQAQSVDTAAQGVLSLLLCHPRVGFILMLGGRMSTAILDMETSY